MTRPAASRPAPTHLPAGATEWLRSGERGTSSNAIFAHLTGMPVMDGWASWGPADPADLRRCRLLLEAVPEFLGQLHRMAELGSRWAALVARWDELCLTMDEETPQWRAGTGSAPRTYAMMKQIEEGAER